MMNLKDELLRFEELAGERVEMVAVGRRRRWLDGGPPRTLDPVPRDAALAALDWEFDADIGSDEQFKPIYAWSASWLLVLTGHDGEVRVAWLPRHPCRCAPEHLGAWFEGQHQADVRRSNRRVLDAHGLTGEDRRFVEEYGPTAREVEADRWSDLHASGVEPGDAVIPFDPSDGARLARLSLRQTLATARDASNLIGREEHAHLLFFLDLADRFTRWLPVKDRGVLPLDPRAPSTLAVLSDRWEAMPPDLARDWREWIGRYDALAARNPRLALADLLARVDAAVDGTGHPFMAAWWPRRLRPGEVPRPDWLQTRLLTAAFAADPFPTLERLRREAAGWVIRDERVGARVFVPDGELDVGGEPYA